MAISPPSDILLDVANAADPVQVKAATAKLAKLASDPTDANGDFARALAVAKDVGPRTASAALLKPTIGAATTMVRANTQGPATTYQKFEALLLQNFVESMLPKNDELYGDKESAGVYRSMMAEQFAAQISKAGGIGIAKAMMAKHPAAAANALTAHATAPTPAKPATA